MVESAVEEVLVEYKLHILVVEAEPELAAADLDLLLEGVQLVSGHEAPHIGYEVDFLAI